MNFIDCIIEINRLNAFIQEEATNIGSKIWFSPSNTGCLVIEMEGVLLSKNITIICDLSEGKFKLYEEATSKDFETSEGVLNYLKENNNWVK